MNFASLSSRKVHATSSRSAGAEPPFASTKGRAFGQRERTLNFSLLGSSAAGLRRNTTLSASEDPLERDADAAAERVLRMVDPAPLAGAARSKGQANPALLQRACSTCAEATDEEAESRLERADSTEGATETNTKQAVHAVEQGGAPLSPALRGYFEPRFGQNFEAVRVHTDARAANAARGVQARAYTLGSNIAFGPGQYSPDTADGQRLLAHELAHVAQGAQASGSASPLLQREPDDKGQPAPTPSSISTSVSAAPAPASPWTPEIPYIHFDLLDFYRSLYVPSGPYFYNAYVYRDRAINQNFAQNLNPAPARAPTIFSPAGFHPQPNDLTWVLATKFYVDSPATPLPAEFSKFETSVDIEFTPTSGNNSFKDHFGDSPTYIPPSGSYALPLSTKPYAFSTTHSITEPGVLTWGAMLRLASVDADTPIQLQFMAPVSPGCADEMAFTADLARLGVRVGQPGPGQKLRPVQVEITKNSRGFMGKCLTVSAVGTPVERVFQDASCEGVSKALAISYAILQDSTSGPFGVSAAGLVQISGSQRLKFEPSSSP